MKRSLSGAPAAVLIVWLAACSSVPPEPDRDEALRSLVEAERAFAAMAASAGIRASFAANFATDGIAFEPAPVHASRAFFSRPAPENAKPLALDWSPVAAGVAASADFGFTTGPSTLTDRASGRSLRNGVYFSVWKRERGGPWRVALDAGTDTATPVEAAALQPSPVIANASADPRRGAAQIAAIETLRASAGDYASWFARDGRLHRDGAAPILGEARVRAHLATAVSTLAFTAQGSAIASSGDLAYTYGAVSVDAPREAGALKSGYYAHLWARGADGRWRLVVAVLMAGA